MARWLYLTAAGIVALMLLGAFALATAREELSSGKRQAIRTGEVVCLPAKKVFFGLFNTAYTDVCWYGFLGQDGNYYHLNVPEQDQWIFSSLGSGELFNVAGTMTVSHPDIEPYKRYNVAAMINVTSVSTVDGSTSIYEVFYGRHYERLTAIADEIYSRTGGGYSMGIDTCEGEPCIRIMLEKDLPELSSKIPRELDGYKVDVQVLNP